MAPGIGRISFANLLLDLIPPVQWRRRFLLSIIVIQFVVDSIEAIISVTQCRPLAAYWDPGVTGICLDPLVQQYFGFFHGCACAFITTYKGNAYRLSSLLRRRSDAGDFPCEHVLEFQHEKIHQSPTLLFDGTRDVVSYT